MMEKNITLGNRPITYQLKKSRRARHLRITIKPGGQVRATLPWQMKPEDMEKFLLKKSGWILKTLRKASKFKLSAMPKGNRRDYLRYKTQALTLAKSKVEHWNRHYNFACRSIKVKNQKTRWGSCSRKGNLNFKYTIVFLPPELCDYLIVHELCHLKEFNHSKNFWLLVSQTFPNYKALRKQLKNI